MNRLAALFAIGTVFYSFAQTKAEPMGLTSVADGKVRQLEAPPEGGAARAIIVEDLPLAHTTQVFPVDSQGKLVGGKEFQPQAEQVFKNLGAALATVGASAERIVKLNLYIVADELAAPTQAFINQRLRGPIRPAVSLVVTRLPEDGALIAADAVALADAARSSRRSSGNDAAAAPGGFAQAAVLPAGERIYISGQAEPGDLKTATRKTLESLRATLKFLGRTDRDVVELKAFVTPMSSSETVKQELQAFFGDLPVPPYSLVEWESTLPIEIELVAAGGKQAAAAEASSRIEYLTPPGMTASPVFSRLARVAPGPLIYVSGLYGGSKASGASQVQAIFQELTEALELTGSDLRHLAKATYYVTNDDASNALGKLRPDYYDPQRPPAASKAMVRGVGQTGKTITLDMIAVPVK